LVVTSSRFLSFRLGTLLTHLTCCLSTCWQILAERSLRIVNSLWLTHNTVTLYKHIYLFWFFMINIIYNFFPILGTPSNLLLYLIVFLHLSFGFATAMFTEIFIWKRWTTRSSFVYWSFVFSAIRTIVVFWTLLLRVRALLDFT